MIILLYGEDNFSSEVKLNKLKKEFFTKNTSNASSSVFDFNEGDFSNEIKIAIRSNGLFAKESLVVVKNLLDQKNIFVKEDILNFLVNNLNNINSSTDLLIFWESKNPKKNNKLFKWLKSNIKSEEFIKLKENQLSKWVKDRFLSLGVEIAGDIVDMLVINNKDNLNTLNNEIIKIATLIGKDKITESLSIEIKKLINSKFEANIFETIEFLSSGNKQKALEMLHKQLDKGDDPFYILSMYIYQFRNLLKIAQFYFMGNTNQYEIASLAKLHPFVVQKGMQQLRGFNLEKLKTIYRELEKIDQQAKIGKVSVELGLDLMIAKL